MRPGEMCGRRDLNPYPLLDTPLKRARMPIPPRPQNKSDYKSREDICQALTKEENTDSLNPVYYRKIGGGEECGKRIS